MNENYGDHSEILVVDDEPEIRSLLKNALSPDFHCETATDGGKALAMATQRRFDLIISDISMPQMTGLELLDKVRTSLPDTKVILMTGLRAMPSARQAIRRGAYDYVQKPFDIAELKRIVREALSDRSFSAGKGIAEVDVSTESDAVRAMADRFSLLPARLSETRMESIMVFVATVEAKDPYTERHSRRVALYSEQLATAVGLDADLTETIRIAAMLHDIGKIGIPDSILTKPGKLTDREFAVVKKHPEWGVQILQHASFLKETLPLILHHHERWDGLGYPEGLAGEAIPEGSRLLHVADAIDAMLSRRSYKRALTVEQVLNELEKNRGRQFDPRFATTALHWLRANCDGLPVNSTGDAARVDRRKRPRALTP